MIAVKEQQDAYLSAYAKLEEQLAERSPAWLKAVRESAINRFAELGFPTTRNEEWKYTNVAPIARTPFRPASGSVKAGPAIVETLQRSPLACVECGKLVFVDGRYSPELSS